MVTANWVQSRPNHWGRDTLMIGSRQNVLYIWMYSIYKCYKWGYNEFPKRAEMKQKQNHRLLLSTVLYLNPARGNALKIHSTLQSAPESLIHCKCCKKPVTRDTHALHLTAPSSQQCLRATRGPWYCYCGRNQKKIRTQNTKKKNNKFCADIFVSFQAPYTVSTPNGWGAYQLSVGCMYSCTHCW